MHLLKHVRTGAHRILSASYLEVRCWRADNDKNHRSCRSCVHPSSLTPGHDGQRSGTLSETWLLVMFKNNFCRSDCVCCLSDFRSCTPLSQGNAIELNMRNLI